MLQLHTEKPFQCTICDKKYCEKGSLRILMRTTTHTVEKTLQCSICDKTFPGCKSTYASRAGHRPMASSGTGGSAAAENGVPDALAKAILQVAQEALLAQDQRAAAAAGEAARALERQLLERDEAARALRAQLNARMQRLETRLNHLEEEHRPAPARAPASGPHSARPVSMFSGQHGASPQEERLARQRVERRVAEVRERARAEPCALGEELCMAAFHGHLEDARRLLEAGADVNYTDSEGYSPLLSALRYARAADVVALLLEKGAQVNAVNVNGKSALHLASRHDPSGRCAFVLVSAAADVDARTADGATPLHWAAKHGNEAAARALLAAGARKGLKCWSGVWEGKAPADVATTPAIRDLLRP